MWRQAVVFLATALMLTGCTTSVEGRIEQAVARGDGAQLRFASMAPFEWDRLHIFGPYTSRQSVHRDLGFEWDSPHAAALESDESSALLVFVQDDEVVESFVYSRAITDFAGLHRDGGYRPAEAQFVVEASDEVPKVILDE